VQQRTAHGGGSRVEVLCGWRAGSEQSGIRAAEEFAACVRGYRFEKLWLNRTENPSGTRVYVPANSVIGRYPGPCRTESAPIA